MPQDRFGNGLNWIKAEEDGLLSIKDSLEGLSNVKAEFTGPPNMNLSDGETTMPDIFFSHSKHAVWNGCALCHPDLFGVKRNVQPYSMQDIFEGEYCGACHGKVAFPNIDCRKCHAKEVF
ncbi:MAG: hypothetical protein C0618_04740 [Desulfuromonas sp.]|nr:MAG: hypothetical protein C0618_04740 [Desulfuromonas sp.]